VIVNLTPHAVTVEVTQDQRIEIPRSGLVARVVENLRPLGVVSVGSSDSGDAIDIEVAQVATGDLVGLPASVPGVHYLVSRIVAEARRDRTDLLFPIDFVRDQAGSIIGCRRLGTFASSLASR